MFDLWAVQVTFCVALGFFGVLVLLLIGRNHRIREQEKKELADFIIKLDKIEKGVLPERYYLRQIAIALKKIEQRQRHLT